MHPNTFLKSFWRNEVVDQVFVAMSFDDKFDKRYEEIIRPSIESEPISGINLTAYRVDNSKTGDSILSEIIDGIAHSRLVLADVSVIDEGRYNETPVRNGNVMYEVGLALACRNPSEVLLVRDDSKKFLFDVSTIPHLTIDFANEAMAIKSLRDALTDRVAESDLIDDARVGIAAQALTEDEVHLLRVLKVLGPKQSRLLSDPEDGLLSLPTAHGLDGLIRKGCIISKAVDSKSGGVFYALNDFGRALADRAEDMPQVDRLTTNDSPHGIPYVGEK